MRLGINGWRIHGQRTGVGRYLLNVIRGWTPELVGRSFEEINLYSQQPLEPSEVSLPANMGAKLLPSSEPMLVWENLRLAPNVDEDVIFCPSYTRPLYVRAKTVVVTHDATQKLHPELFSRMTRAFYTPLYGWCARNATMVITTTEAARRDIAHVWNVPLLKIRVTRLAPAECFQPLPRDSHVDEVRRRLTGGAPFFFFVGKLSGRRNIPVLLEAFREFKRSTKFPHKLVMVGPDTAALNMTALGESMGLGENFIRLKYAADDELNLLYNSAEIFVMPSTYETLSFPVMECQATGTPVISIDTPGARENTGGAALFIRRLEVNELVAAMSRLAGDSSLRRELAERGLENAQTFSWQKCSRETLGILEEAAHAGA